MYGARIVIADSDAFYRQKLYEMLTKTGYIIVAQEGDGLKAIQSIQNMQPDLVIVDAQLPGKNGLELAKIIEEDKIAPVLLLASYHQKEIIHQAKESWIFAYLVKPINEANLFPAIEIAIAKYKKLIELEREVIRLKESLETRKVVERAKGVLMQVLNLNEETAFKLLRTQSMQRRLSMRQIAELILSFDIEDLKNIQ